MVHQGRTKRVPEIVIVRRKDEILPRTQKMCGVAHAQTTVCFQVLALLLTPLRRYWMAKYMANVWFHEIVWTRIASGKVEMERTSLIGCAARAPADDPFGVWCYSRFSPLSLSGRTPTRACRLTPVWSVPRASRVSFGLQVTEAYDGKDGRGSSRREEVVCRIHQSKARGDRENRLSRLWQAVLVGR